MSITDLQRITDFCISFAQRQASTVKKIPYGVAVSDSKYPDSHEHNQLIVTSAPVPGDILIFADEEFGHLNYRRITVLDNETGNGCASTFIAAGYSHEIMLIMVHSGPSYVSKIIAEDVDLVDLRPAVLKQLRIWMPDATDEVLHQLVDRRTARLRGADLVYFLATRDEHGIIGSWADLYVDPDLGVAQIEDIATADTHTRRGGADSILAFALRRTETSDLRFLLADLEDWPRTWYARRGFSAIGRLHIFTRIEI